MLISHFKIIVARDAKCDAAAHSCSHPAQLPENPSAVFYAIDYEFQNRNDSNQQHKQAEPVFHIKNGFRPSQKLREGLGKIFHFLHCATLILHIAFPQFTTVSSVPVQNLPPAAVRK